MEQSPAKLQILAKIEEFEKNEWWDKDIEDDPEQIPLLPNKIDYLNKKLSTKLKTFVANHLGDKFFKNMIKNRQLIIKEVKGIENFTAVKSGAIITSNHFNVCDQYAVFTAIRNHMKKGTFLYKVVKEGNYTNPPKAFSLFLKYCNTLPLSSNMETMKKFMSAMNVLLQRGEKILVYPEQAMWWNYKKPRPLKSGAYRFAVNNNVPVIPMFITMEDSDVMDPDGFPVQAYTINILPAIYPNADLSKNENMEYMKNENYAGWVKTYEDFYKTKLVYNTNNSKSESNTKTKSIKQSASKSSTKKTTKSTSKTKIASK